MNVARSLRLGIGLAGRLLRADVRAGVAQSYATVLAGHFARMALGLVSSAVLARGLGPAGLSAFAVVGAALAVGLTVADYGLGNATVRQTAVDLERRPAAAQRTAGAYVRFKLLATLLVAGLFWLLAGPLARLLNLPPEGPALVRLAGLGLLASGLSGIPSTLLHALRRFRAMVMTQLLNAGLTAVALAGLALAGRLSLMPALLVGAGAAGAAALLGFWLLPAEWRRPAWRSPLQAPEGRRLLAFGKWLWLSAILSALATQLDLLLLNRWLAPAAVGFYALALNLSFKANVINQALRTVLLPQASALHGRQAYLRYIRGSLARSGILAGVALAPILVARPFILVVYGAEYLPSVGIFYALMVVVVLDIVYAPLFLLAYALNMPRVIALSDGVRVAALLVAGVLLIPPYGAFGAVAAKGAGMVAGAIVTLWAIRRRLASDEPLPVPAPETESPPTPLPGEPA